MGMEKLALQISNVRTVVEVIARQRMSDRRQVDADLVSSTGVQFGFEKGEAGKIFDDRERRSCRTSRDAERRHPFSVVWITADRRFNASLGRLEPSGG